MTVHLELAAMVLTLLGADTKGAAPLTNHVVIGAARAEVPGFASPWLAGMPAGTKGAQGTVAPNHSPVLVSGLSLRGSTLTFTVTGKVSTADNYQKHPLEPPDGSATIVDRNLALFGIAEAAAPRDALMGVFLGPEQPDRTPAPEALDFSQPGKRDFLVLEPRLKQVFFIGDGMTRGGMVQQFRPPAGATRLYLGTMDHERWFNNTGEFKALIREHQYKK
jgi:hypothetical protein